MNEKEKQLQHEIGELLKEAERTDAEEDTRYGKGNTEYERFSHERVPAGI
jgi:hypothetical protein